MFVTGCISFEVGIDANDDGGEREKEDEDTRMGAAEQQWGDIKGRKAG